jgi:hypothetical protein
MHDFEEGSGRTELWSNDPLTGEATLIEVFEHPLTEDDLRAFAVAAALQFIEYLTVDDLWMLS